MFLPSMVICVFCVNYVVFVVQLFVAIRSANSVMSVVLLSATFVSVHLHMYLTLPEDWMPAVKTDTQH